MKQYPIIISCIILILLGMFLGWILTYEPPCEDGFTKEETVFNEENLKGATFEIQGWYTADGKNIEPDSTEYSPIDGIYYNQTTHEFMVTTKDGLYQRVLPDMLFIKTTMTKLIQQ